MTKRPNFSMLGARVAPVTQAVPATVAADEVAREPMPAMMQRQIEDAVCQQPAKGRASSRANKSALTMWVDRSASRQLAQLALNMDVSKEHLLRQALNDLFDRNGLARLA